MNSKDPNGPELSSLLRKWPVSAKVPPRFEEEVWRRIEKTKATATPPFWRAFARWIGSYASRPSFAGGLTALVLISGLAAGLWQGEKATRRAHEALSARYLQSIDPYLSPSR